MQERKALGTGRTLALGRNPDWLAQLRDILIHSGREPVFLFYVKTHFYLLHEISSYYQSTPTSNCPAYRANLTMNV